MRRFEFIDQKSKKFWECSVENNVMIRRWGRIGTAGQEKRETFANSARAQEAAEALIAEKLADGYREVLLERTHNPELETLVESGRQKWMAREYADALPDFERALKLEQGCVSALYGAAYCCCMLSQKEKGHRRDELIDRQLELAGRLIARIPEESLLPYLKEHMFARESLRFAYNSFAWHGMKRAKNEADLRQALAYIDRGLSLVSPLDDPGTLLGYAETKVRILLALGRQDEAFALVSRNPKFQDYADIVKQKEYKTWRSQRSKMKPSTPVEAVRHLAESIAQYGHPNYSALVFSPPIPSEEVKKAEARLGTKLPPSYVAFVTTHGCFKLLKEAPKMPADYSKLIGSRGLLSPKEIADETLNTRKAYTEAEEEAAPLLDDSLLFHENYYRDNFYAFRISDGKRHGGEMGVQCFYHDDEYVFERGFWPFEQHIIEWAGEVLEED